MDKMISLRHVISFFLSNERITPSSICTAMHVHYLTLCSTVIAGCPTHDRWLEIAKVCEDSADAFRKIGI